MQLLHNRFEFARWNTDCARTRVKTRLQSKIDGICASMYCRIDLSLAASWS
jgi:hypothetical protein